jgi:hypothetical protein
VLTRAAQQIVTPLTASALSHQRAFTDLFDPNSEFDAGCPHFVVERHEWDSPVFIRTYNSTAYYGLTTHSVVHIATVRLPSKPQWRDGFMAKADSGATICLGWEDDTVPA